MANAAVTGSIQGKVTSASGHVGIEGAEVCAYKIGGAEFEEGVCNKTNTNGEYSISELAAGEYKVEFFAANEVLNYLTQYYNNKSTFEAAEAVPVAAGAPTDNIDAEMQEGGRIKGVVTSASSHAPIKNIVVCAEALESGRCALSNENGEYILSGLQTGEYKVEFLASFFGLNYLTEFYDNKKTKGEAKPVSVTVGATQTEINAAMQEGGEIAGTVIDAASHAVLPGIEVCAVSEERGLCVLTSSGGDYTIPGLPAGSYLVEFAPESREESAAGYVTQYYNNEPTQALANLVSVTPPETSSGIDASLVRSSTLRPASTEAPQLSGAPTPGGTLFCSTGVWSNDPTSYAYKWLRDGAPVVGQTASTYAVQAGDQGQSIVCQVTAFDKYGSGTATSNILQISIATSAPPGPSPVAKEPPKCKRGFKKTKAHGESVCRKTKKHHKKH